MLALPFADGNLRRRDGRLRRSNVADLELGAARAAARARSRRPARDPRDHAAARPLRPFFSLWFDRIVPLLGKVLPGGSAYTYLPASVKRFPTAEGLVELLARRASARSRFRLLGGSIVALHTGVAA